jgi:cytochrome c-type biogenesis protein CcmH
LSIKRAAQLGLITVIALLTLGADFDQVRFEKVGHELVCTCGCNQILLECNHVGCTVSDGMRKQVADGIRAGKDDDAILASFVDQFGPTVLAAPTKTGFDRVAWVTPYLVFIVGIAVAIFFVSRWRSKHSVAGGSLRSTAAASNYLEQARRETEI